MATKQLMQIAKSNCNVQCCSCKETFNSKYGILEGEPYCPKCYNLYVVKYLTDTRFTQRIRKNRTIFRLIFFVITLASFILATIYRDRLSDSIYAMIVVLCSLLGIIPFYEDFIAFITKGFYGFFQKEATIHRNKVIYYENGIIDNEETGALRVLFYIIDFILVWPCMALLYIFIPVRSIIDIVRVCRANKKIDSEMKTLLPPYGGSNEITYDYSLRFVDSYSTICLDYYKKHFHVKTNEEAMDALDKSTIIPIFTNVNYKEGYRKFIDWYDGRRDYDGKRYIFLDVKVNETVGDGVHKTKSGKRTNR